MTRTTKTLFNHAAELPLPAISHRWGSAVLLRTVVRVGPIWWMFYDVTVALLAIQLAYYYAPKSIYIADPLQLAAFPFLVIVAGTIAGLYERNAIIRLGRLLVAVSVMTVLATFALALFSHLAIFQMVGRWVLTLNAAFMLLGCGAPRIAGYFVTKYLKIRVLLVGDKTMSSTLARHLKHERSPYALVGFCNDEPTRSENALGGINDIPQICPTHQINLVVIGSQYIQHPHVLDRCFEAIQSGCDLADECTFFERAFQMVLVDRIDPGWFYTASLGKHNDFQAIIKRGMDLLLALIGLLLTAPLFPIIWALIRLTSWGPAFYSQQRCGQFGRPFTIHKFRTMSIDAEASGVQWATPGDSRVTPIGYFLRKMRLDEIPQFWNVLKGEMSFVGPRPERPELVDEIEREVPFFSFRHWARPGLTGLAQTRYRYGSSIDDAKQKMQHDLYYIKNWSILLDLQIMLRTFATIMRGSR